MSKDILRKSGLSFCIVTVACFSAGAIGLPVPGKIIDTVVCKADPTQSYALYMPVKKDKSVSPILYFFDPHADGSLPLHKYKSIADKYGFILVGSNNSKNGNDWSTTGKIWQTLFDDTKNRVSFDRNRLYTVGFSGGAKVAGYIAILNPQIKGVIANGAGLPDGTPAGDFNFSFTAISGEGDMNLTELVAVTHDFDNTRTPHRILFFDGKHEWAPEATMDRAFTGLQLDGMRQGLVAKDDLFIGQYIEKSKKRVNALSGTGQLIKAREECSFSISLLDGLSPAARWFLETAQSLDKNNLYQKQRQAEQTLLVTEQNTKADYGEHFQQGDLRYWSATINDLKARSAVKNASTGMYQRLLAYLSLAFYSLSNRLIGSHADQEAEHFVQLYKMADPTNSEAWYFSALLHARRGQTKETENDLRKAVGYGFKDRKRMKQQPEFQNLSPALKDIIP